MGDWSTAGWVVLVVLAFAAGWWSGHEWEYWMREVTYAMRTAVGYTVVILAFVGAVFLLWWAAESGWLGQIGSAVADPTPTPTPPG